MSRNVDDQSETFGRLDEASQELDEAAASLYRIEQLRLTDDTAARLAVEGARLGKEESISLGAQAARAAAAEFGDFSSVTGSKAFNTALGFAGPSRSAQLLQALGGQTDGLADLARGQFGLEGNNRRVFESTFGNEEFLSAVARSLAKTGGSVADLANSRTMPEKFARVLAQEMQAAGLAANVTEKKLENLLSEVVFSTDPNEIGTRVNAIQILQTMQADNNANAREPLQNLSQKVKFARQEEFSGKGSIQVRLCMAFTW